MDRRDGPLARALDLGHSAFWGLILAGVVVFLAGTWMSARQRSREAGRRVAELRREVEEARHVNERLAAEKEGLTSDPVHVERMMRRKFHMIAPGEVKVEPEEAPPSTENP